VGRMNTIIDVAYLNDLIS